MTSVYDALETRPAAQREAALMAALPGQLAHAKRSSPAFAELLQAVDTDTVTHRVALARLPVIRKHGLQQRQSAARQQGVGAQQTGAVFGGFSAVAYGAAMPRVFASPGPIYEPEGTSATTGAWPAPFTRPGSARAS